MSSKVVHNPFELKERELVAKMKGQREALKCVHEKIASITQHMESERNPKEQESRRALQAAMMDQGQLQQGVHKILSGNAEVHKVMMERDQLQQEVQKQREKNFKELTDKILLEKMLEENQKTLVQEKILKEENISRGNEIRAEIEMLKNYRHNEDLKDELGLEVQRLAELLRQERDNYQRESTQLLQLEKDFEKIQEELRDQKNLNQEFLIKENQTRKELEKLRNNNDAQTQRMILQVRQTSVDLMQKDVEELATAYLEREERFFWEKKTLTEELEKMTASYKEVTSKCGEVEKLSQALEQRLKMEVQMNEENVKNNLNLIQTIRADQDVFCKKMEEEMEAVRAEASLREQSLREEVEELKAQLNQKEELQEQPLTHFEVNFHIEFLPRSLTPDIPEEEECRRQMVKVQMTRKNNYHSVRTPDLSVLAAPSDEEQIIKEATHLEQNPTDATSDETDKVVAEEDHLEDMTVQEVSREEDVVGPLHQQQQHIELQQNTAEEALSGQDSLGWKEDSEAQQDSLGSEEFVILEEIMDSEEILSPEPSKRMPQESLEIPKTEDLLRFLDMLEAQEKETVVVQDDSLRDEGHLDHIPEGHTEVQLETSEDLRSAHDTLSLAEEDPISDCTISEKTASSQEFLLSLDMDQPQQQAGVELQQIQEEQKSELEELKMEPREKELEQEMTVENSPEQHLKLQTLNLKDMVESHDDLLHRADIAEPQAQKWMQIISDEQVPCPQDVLLRPDPKVHYLDIADRTAALQEDLYLRNTSEELDSQQDQKLEDLKIPEEILSDLDKLLLRENIEDLRDQEDLHYETSEAETLNKNITEVHPKEQELSDPQQPPEMAGGPENVREEDQTELHQNLLNELVTPKEVLMENMEQQKIPPLDSMDEELNTTGEMPALPANIGLTGDGNLTPQMEFPEEHQSPMEMEKPPPEPPLQPEEHPEDDSEVNVDIGTSVVDLNPQPQKSQTFLEKAHQYLKLKSPARCIMLKTISQECSSSASSSPQRFLGEKKLLGEVKSPEDPTPDERTEAVEEDFSNEEVSVQEELSEELQREMPTSKKVWRKTCQFLNLKTLGKKKRPADSSPARSLPSTFKEQQDECRPELDVQIAEERVAELLGHLEETHLSDSLVSESQKGQIVPENLQPLEMTQQKSLTGKKGNILSEFSLASPLTPVSPESQKTYEIEVQINRQEVQQKALEGLCGAEGKLCDLAQEDSEELQNLSIQVKLPDLHRQELDEVAQNRLKILNLQMVCKGPLNILQTKAFFSVSPPSFDGSTLDPDM